MNKLTKLFRIRSLTLSTLWGPFLPLILISLRLKEAVLQSALTVHHCSTISQLRKQLMDYRLLAAEEVSKHINGDH